MLAKQLQPQFVKGHWRKPEISLRQANILRKSAILHGLYKTGGKLEEKGWDPSWDRMGAQQVLKQDKGSKRERNREERVKAITRLVQDMPAKMDAFSKEKESKKDKSFLQFILKREKLIK